MAPNNNTELSSVANDIDKNNVESNINNDNIDVNNEEEEQVSQLKDWEAPKAQGLYDPQNEHEACGVGFIVAIDGRRNHKVRNFSFFLQRPPLSRFYGKNITNA